MGLPVFSLKDSTYSYGRLDNSSNQPFNRHFVPRLAKLVALSGESITFYQQWRQMQFDLNKVMVRFMIQAGFNCSFLPPVKNYAMWLRNRAEEENDLAIDPCPDCDVRFSRDAKLPMMAGTSILVKSRWKRRSFEDSVILIGLPEHITCGL